jgi:hypothetical protein
LAPLRLISMCSSSNHEIHEWDGSYQNYETTVYSNNEIVMLYSAQALYALVQITADTKQLLEETVSIKLLYYTVMKHTDDKCSEQ